MGFAPVMMAVGTAVSVYSAFAGASAMEDGANYNAQVLESQAVHTEQAAAADAESHARSFDKFRGSLVSDIAAYGGSASSGTGLLLAQEAARQAKLDELNIITDGQNRAASARNGAEITRFEGAAGARQRRLGGLGTALAGFGQAAYAAGIGQGGQA